MGKKEGYSFMHNVVASIFKIIGMSLILMLLLDTIFTVVDTLNVRSRVQDVESILKYELAKNNAIPDEMGQLLDAKLQDIVEDSKIATRYRWNWQSTINTYGKSYTPINEANVRDYGEEIEYVIQLDMRVQLFTFGGQTVTPNGDNFNRAEQGIIYVSTYSDVVPALRYLR